MRKRSRITRDKLIQDLGKISAAVLLNDQRRDQKTDIDQGHSIGQMLERIPNGDSVILFFKSDGKFPRDRFGGFLSDQFQGGSEGMAGAHRAAQHV